MAVREKAWQSVKGRGRPADLESGSDPFQMKRSFFRSQRAIVPGAYSN